MDTLPTEILFTILENLDYFTLKRLTLVCRFFNTLFKPHPSSTTPTILDKLLFREISPPPSLPSSLQTPLIHPAFKLLNFPSTPTLSFTFNLTIRCTTKHYIDHYTQLPTILGTHLHGHPILSHENFTSPPLPSLTISIKPPGRSLRRTSHLREPITLYAVTKLVISSIVNIAVSSHISALEDREGGGGGEDDNQSTRAEYSYSGVEIGENMGFTYIYKWPKVFSLKWEEGEGEDGGLVLKLRLSAPYVGIEEKS